MAKQNNKKRITFSFSTPEAESIFLAGSFNAWDPTDRPMKPDKKGTWKTTISLAPGRHEYRFVVDGEWQDDPACEERNANPFGTYNCLVSV